MIPHFDIPMWSKSDQGTHFKSRRKQLLAKTVMYALKFHALYHLQSSGQMEHKKI
jgi:hypothetical protein